MKRLVSTICLATAGFGGVGLQGDTVGFAAPAPEGTVLVDQAGIGMHGAQVRNEQRWVITSLFNLPKGDWGVTYAYRCSGKGDFWMAVAQTDIDGFNPLTVVYRRKPHGRGFKMETGKVKSQSLDPIADSPGLSTDLQTLQIQSRCRWHVRVVVGSATVVAQHIPALP